MDRARAEALKVAVAKVAVQMDAALADRRKVVLAMGVVPKAEDLAVPVAQGVDLVVPAAPAVLVRASARWVRRQPSCSRSSTPTRTIS